MSVDRLLEITATLAAIIYFTARTIRPGQDRQTRMVWWATLLAAAGLLAHGILVPVHILDAPLGGRNWINLVQNLCSLLAFWLGRQAILGLAFPERRRREWPLIAASGIAVAIPFALIEKAEPTSDTFISDQVGQLAMWFYVVVYMGIVGAVAVSIVTSLLRRRRVIRYIPFVAGAALVVIACAEEIVYITAAHFRLVDADASLTLLHGFGPLFYAGIGLIFASLYAFLITRWARRRRIQRLTARLRAAAGAQPRPGSGALVDLYELVVGIRDANSLSAAGDPEIEALLQECERLLTRHLEFEVPQFRKTVIYGSIRA